MIKTATPQRTADALKGIVLSGKQDSLWHKAALLSISRFESADWQPILFELAGEAVQTPLEFGEDGSLAGEITGELDAAQVVSVLLGTYFVLLDSEEDEQFFTTDEAAEYMGVERWTIDHHYRRSRKLKGVKRGGTLFFRKTDLDAFKEVERKSGNPH